MPFFPSQYSLLKTFSHSVDITGSAMWFYEFARIGSANRLITHPAHLNSLFPQVRSTKKLETHPNCYYAFYAIAIFSFKLVLRKWKDYILLSILVLLTCYNAYLFLLSCKRALTALVSDHEHILPFLVQAP